VSAERILVDTSAWVEYFRGGNKPLSILMEKWMDERSIYIPDVVLAELMQGARTEAESETVEELRGSFEGLELKPGTWIEAGKLSRSLRKMGKMIHLTDCFIAEVAFQHGCAVLTYDAHFVDIRRALDFQLIVLPK